jgi:putative membrane protein
VYRVWRRAGVGHGISRWEFAAFVSGWLTLVLALVSPLHPWGSVLFSAHMSQHELLMLVAAPLLVIGKPLVAFLRGMPAAWAATLIRGFGSAAWTPVWRFLTNPFVAWLIHAAVLWIWHIPSLFEATLENELVHALQHLSFVLSALLFWWAVMQGPRRAMNFGVATLYMFTTALHSGALGALLTFAKSLWYPAYAASTHDWGLSPLEDQQLGGLIMWVPACLVYLVAGLALCAGSMRESERRTERAELLRSLAEREVVA